jgi:hypothetical protein
MQGQKWIVIVGALLIAGCSGSDLKTRTTPVQYAAPAGGATITATPNPVPVTTAKGSTTIAWSTGDTSQGEVYLATSKQPEILFGGLAPHGSQAAPWISKGGKYEFKLYAGKDHAKVLASVVVTTTSQ